MEAEKVRCGGVDLEVQIRGGGPPLLLLHGEDGLLFSQPFLDELAKRFELHIPHHPGWGATPVTRWIESPRDIGDLYLHYLAGLGAAVPVVGVSFGAWIAAEMATTSTHDIRRLVLAAPVGCKLGDVTDRDFADIYLADRGALPAILYGDPDRAPDTSQLTTQAECTYLATAQEAVVRYCWQPYFHSPSLHHRLQRIATPTLVVGGSNDRFVLTPDYRARIADLIGPNARVESIEGCGHRVEEEAPHDLAAAICDFLGPVSAA